ncbi:MAG: hypothetical protein GC204_15255 [Chloroflexi bacterium]|nr:hypothetical protein [Chloroflexota bacterium]
MADIRFEDVLELAEQLTPEEQKQLIAVLQTKPASHKRPPLNFPVDDLGAWTKGLSLRREDWYGCKSSIPLR